MKEGYSLRLLVLVTLCLTGAVAGQATEIAGEQLSPAAIGEGVVESWDAVLVREETLGMSRELTKAAGTKPGVWYVPSSRSTYYPASGVKNVMNKWGDPDMGIGFPTKVDVVGAWFSGQGGKGCWAPAIRAIAYKDGVETARTDWKKDIGEKPVWLEMEFKNVDRIVIEAQPLTEGVAFYAMDDLTYVPISSDDQTSAPVVIDFEDIHDRQNLTSSGYAGLTWESGKGQYNNNLGVPAPRPADSLEKDPAPVTVEPIVSGSLRGGTAPELLTDFEGLDRSESGGSYPPDTCGAIGPNHYVECVNEQVAIYDRDTLNRISSVSLSAFFPSMSWGGDPRVMFDNHDQRWIILASGFNNDSRIHFAYSNTSNPTGTWFKTYIDVGQSAWPDYETLGVNKDAIFTASYLVGTNTIAIFVIDKSNLLSALPSMGVTTAFRNLSLEGAIQPAETFGDSDYEYLVSAQSSTRLRLYRISPPMTSPTITNWSVTVPRYYTPSAAPALGSSTNLDVVGTRPMNAVWRDGYLWTAHCVSISGRAAVRWYQIDTDSHTLTQSGTVSDSSLHYYFPAINVNALGQVLLGFSGSDANQYASIYACGRVPTDPSGNMSTPILLKAGTGSQNNLDGYGRNRWGDYSLTTVDPLDDQTFYTAQTYGKSSNIWGTWISVLSYGDCNNNGIDDEDDISGGTSLDCNSDLIPDECQLINNDCDSDSVPDDCQAAELIDTQPSDDQSCEGSTATFTVTSSAVSPSYQWYKGGVPLGDNGHYSGTTTASLLISDVTADDVGTYRCRITKGCISTYTRYAAFSLGTVAGVVTHPQNTEKCRGESVALSTVFSGLEPITYRWEKDGQIVPGATDSSLQIASADTSDAGNYVCVATNPCGDSYSDEAVLTIGDAPLIAGHPIDTCVNAGENAQFHVQLDGTPPYFCLWSHDGVDIAGQNGTTLTISSVQEDDAGEYSAICVSYAATDCEVSTDSAELTVGDCGGVCEFEIFGDVDGDGDSDLADFARFQVCFGSNMAYEPGCECANLDASDYDVDLDDYLLFQIIIAGPGHAPY